MGTETSDQGSHSHLRQKLARIALTERGQEPRTGENEVIFSLFVMLATYNKPSVNITFSLITNSNAVFLGK